MLDKYQLIAIIKTYNDVRKLTKSLPSLLKVPFMRTFFARALGCRVYPLAPVTCCTILLSMKNCRVSKISQKQFISSANNNDYHLVLVFQLKF